MWPFRPETISDVLPRDDLKLLLRLGDSVGSAVTLIERGEDANLTRLDPEAERSSDPFCSYFRLGRVGGKLAFDGADEACAACEMRLARRALQPQPGASLPARDSGAVASRCHMGLTDYLVPVTVGGKPLAALIAGRRVETDEDRMRIRKIVGKLGKLTRAEAEKESAADRLIEPAEEKARDRLVQEIASIPLASPELERALSRLAKLLGRIASRGFEGSRRMVEDRIIERIDARMGEAPKQFGDLRRETSELLEEIQNELGFEHLALFAATPKDLDDPDARASLVAESGLNASTAKRLIELDWSKLPSVAASRDADAMRGLSALSAAHKALESTRDAPPGLKDRITSSFFFAPVECGPHLRAALAFGAPRSTVEPDSTDLQFLARIARAFTRRYYALAADIERRWLSQHLENEGTARREAEGAKRELERTEGFTYFDARKILNQCLERIARRVETRKVEIDTRDCLDRVTFRGVRREITALFQRLLEEGIERTLVDPETQKGSPIRVFLRRSRTRLFFGTESIGDYLDAHERRALFAKDASTGNGSGESDRRDPAPSRAPPPLSMRPPVPREGRGEPPDRSLGEELASLRRHEGRIRVESERLHRWERDRNRWLGKTTFLVDLPLPVRPPDGERRAGAESRPGAESCRGAVSRERRKATPAPAGGTKVDAAPVGSDAPAEEKGVVEAGPVGENVSA